MGDREYLLGIDVGTSGSKGVIVDLTGRVVAFTSVDHGVDTPRPGWYEHDADAIWWTDLKTITRVLIAEGHVEPGAIAAVGVSALRPDMLPVDDNGTPLRKAILYCDGRAKMQIDQIARELADRAPSQVSAKSVSTHFSGPKILWFRQNEPTLYERTARIHTGSSYLVFKLTGESRVSFGEAMGYAPLFDAQRMEWDQDICGRLDLPVALLPSVGWATDVAGGVSAEAARETGLVEGTPVIIGTGDAMAETLSVGAVLEGDAALLYGSTMVLAVMGSERFARRCAELARPGPMPGTHMVITAMSTSGALTTWFRDNFAQAEQEAEARLGTNAYQLLNDQADQVPPGSEGLIVLPYFAGERGPIWDSQARGLMIGLTLSHTRKHVYRALLEGVAYGLRQNVEILEERGAVIKRIVSTGGGTRSRLWPQIVSDVLGKDQEVIVNPIGAPYGDAFLAGYGVGVLDDPASLHEQWAPEASIIRCEPETTAVYDRYYRVYCDLYDQNKDSMHALAELSTLV